MLNLLNVASSDTAFDGEGVSVSLDTTQNSAFSFNNLLSLGDKSQSNNVNIGIFDNFLNSDNILEIDLKHLSQIVDKNPTASLNMKSALIVKLDELKTKLIDDGLINTIIDKLNNIKPITNNQNNSQKLSVELKERILFTPNNKIKKPLKPNANITINSIQDIEKISNEYGLNISKIKIEVLESTNLKAYKNTQLQTNIDNPKILDTSDVILFKKIKNKSVDNSNNSIKNIFTSFTDNNVNTKSNTVKILPNSTEVYPIKEVEKINRLAFFHKSKIEDFKDSKSFKDIQSLNNSDFKHDSKDINIAKIIVNDTTKKPTLSTPNSIADNETYSLKDVLLSVSKQSIPTDKNIDLTTTISIKSNEKSIETELVNKKNENILVQEKSIQVQEKPIQVQEKSIQVQKKPIQVQEKPIQVQEKSIQVQEIQKKTTSFYQYEPMETISIDNERQTTLKKIFDLKDKIISNEKHILDDSNKEKEKHIITSKETSKQLAQKPALMKTTLVISPSSKPSSSINVKLDNKVNKTKLLNSLMDNSINRMAITNEAQDNKRIKVLIQELSQINKEPLENKKETENKSIKIKIEPLVLNEKDLTTNSEKTQVQESTTGTKSTIIDVSKFAESNQSKELNQIMQRQIINGVYENLKYKLSNFVAPLMKFALELNPSHLGRIEVEIMVRGSNLQVSIKSSKKISSLLEEEGSELEKEFSVLGYKNIIMNFSGTDSGSNNKAKKDKETNAN